ncbi:hypothetical protein [Cylindrospermopsis raciborskii]|uniref:hypothetical protein n=1 Tax=Cylindrospermopsis raciborskii TaxID=77022 RepID=UPI00215515CC|nr:hypothetical protein [Cylindrospermopsis raciborskii]
MIKLEELKQGSIINGILPGQAVTVIDAKWFGTDTVELTYKDIHGSPYTELVFRDREESLQIVNEGKPWSFDGDGETLCLVSEAHRINLAYLFDPLLAVHTSLVEPLPHQITAVYSEMLNRQPLRNGKEEDFQLFLALLDGDRFEGRFRDGVHVSDTSDLMRPMVKEELLKFDGKPLFPERIARTERTRETKPQLKRFHGTVEIDPLRINRDAPAIANEIIQHLTRLKDAKVRIVLEIEADIPDGVPDDVVRTVTENCRTLKFNSQAFEQE